MYASPSEQGALLLADVCIVAATGWLVAVPSGHARRNVLEATIAWLLACVGVVTAVGLVLGMTRGFGQIGFLVGHLLIAGAVVFGSGSARLRSAAGVLRERWQEAGRFLCARSGAAIGAWVLGAMMAALAVIAAFEPPTIMDTLSYHLPRVGVWLQDGRMSLIGASDARMDFVASLPEVVMAWIVSGSREGFPGVGLIQVVGGALLVCATIGMARKTGLSRGASVLTAALLFGMQNIVAQFTATQTDLYTAGLLAGAFYLWWCALDRGEVSIPGALGAGLALGAKGTLFYLAPGALLWVALLTWRAMPTLRWWTLTLMWGAAGMLFFAGPGFYRNLNAFGDPFGPRDWVGRVHGTPGSVAERGRMMVLNGATSLAQNFQPVAQPHILRPAARAAGSALGRQLSAHDPYSMDGLDRTTTVTELINETKPDADAPAFGTVTLFLVLLGTTAAIVRSARAEAQLVLAWAVGVFVFLAFFHAMQLWHPFAFRYFVIAGPWIAIVAAWGIEQLPRVSRISLWVVALAATADVAWTITFQSPLSGWNALTRPAGTPAYHVMQQWRAWSEQLAPAGSDLTVALPENRPVTAFFQQAAPRRVRLVPTVHARTAEELVRGTTGWTIVPAAQFSGHEGDVVEKVWLFKGNSAAAVSLSAFRSRLPGEKSPPLLYYTQVTSEQGTLVHSMLLKTWAESHVAFSVLHPAGGTYEVRTPSGRSTGDLPAGERARVTVELAPNAINEVRWIVRGSPSEQPPSVELLP